MGLNFKQWKKNHMLGCVPSNLESKSKGKKKNHEILSANKF